MNCKILEELYVNTCNKCSNSIMETEKKDFSTIKEMQISNCIQSIKLYMKYCDSNNYNNTENSINKFIKIT